MNEAQRKKFEEEWYKRCKGEKAFDVDKWSLEKFVDEILSVSDGGWKNNFLDTCIAYVQANGGDVKAIRALGALKKVPPPKDSPTSDGLEHSQHKCGCEEVIKAYKEALELIRDTDDLDDFSHDTAKEVLTRMESHKLPEVR